MIERLLKILIRIRFACASAQCRRIFVDFLLSERAASSRSPQSVQLFIQLRPDWNSTKQVSTQNAHPETSGSGLLFS